MPSLTFSGITKSYGDTSVITSLDAHVEDGEFLVLLGPSGCGKSTLLRMIAGLADITSGELAFDGEVANSWSVRERQVAFVFQSYALYPHMTVRGNIAFPLVMDEFKGWHHLPLVNSIVRRRMVRSPAIQRKTEQIARQLELEPLLDRKPAQLSGGQRQRVALARSLVRDPALYLLDEPLSNLDAKLRTQMRAEISELHAAVGKTFVYVTHDQVEAMTMASRIIVLDGGVVQQIGTPEEVYATPANTFVARFVGAPPMNLLDVVRTGSTLTSPSGDAWSHQGAVPGAGPLVLGLRPESLRLTAAGRGRLEGDVAVVERLGGETLVGVRLSRAGEPPALVDHDLCFVRVPGRPAVRVGEACGVDYDESAAVWFDRDTRQRILA
ncbi:ABC transporter ATP-binding protein [Kineococcus sp. TBRC 1896]|uniref:ABC transporter ATP-binding protein n=1 Tax=Kineococcus mangrovi TaxID=1660183 RepID=A0ABV4HWM0_9ACTN